MSFLLSLRHSANLTARSTAAAARLTAISSRGLHTSKPAWTSTGYGDPTDEKAANKTPTPSSTPDPKSGGQSGTTDPEIAHASGKDGDSGPKVKAGGATNASGKGGGQRADGKPNEMGDVTGKEIRETKKIGEDPKKEEVGGAGVIGG